MTDNSSKSMSARSGCLGCSGCLFNLFMAVLIICSGIYIYSASVILRNGEEALAKTVSFGKVLSKIEYEADGNMYSLYTSAKSDEDGSINIRYDKEKPRKAVTAEDRNNMIYVLIGLIAVYSLARWSDTATVRRQAAKVSAPIQSSQNNNKTDDCQDDPGSRTIRGSDDIELARTIERIEECYKSGKDSTCDKIFTELMKKKNIDSAFYPYALYNIGNFYWNIVGNGTKALQAWKKLWDEIDVDSYCKRYSYNNREEIEQFLEFSAENAMTISPDIDEFRKWTDRLRTINPNAPIIREIGKTNPERYEDGTPWYEMMFERASNYYNRTNPAINRGAYGAGCSIWQLMVENRKKLRLPDEVWEIAVFELGVLSNHLVADKLRSISVNSSYDMDEAKVPLRYSIGYIRDFEKYHPNSEGLRKLLENINQNMSM